MVRTTITLEDDVVEALRREERRTHASFKDVVNRALRSGLALGDRPAPALPPFVVESRACGFLPGIDPRRLNQLVDELETDAFVGHAAKAVK